MDGMLTIKQIADRLHVNKATVYTWVHNGKLNAYKAGNLWRITEEQLQEFLNHGQEARQQSGEQSSKSIPGRY